MRASSLAVAYYLVASVAWAAALEVGRRGDPLVSVGVAGAALAVAAFWRFHGAPLFMTTPRALLLGATGGAVLVAGTYLVFPLVAQAPAIRWGTADLYAQIGAFSALRALALAAVVVAEELAWRGPALDALPGSPRARLAVGTLAYAAAHVAFGGWLLAGVALLCGLAWGGLRLGTRGVVAPIVCHLAWDLSIMVLRPLG